MDILLEPFHYDFLVRAFIAGVALAVVAPIVGIFLVVRGFALFADALAHVSLLGVALSVATGMPVIAGAVATAVAASIGMEAIRSARRELEEGVLALFLSGSLALAIVILSLTGGGSSGLFSYLFGSLSTVTVADIALLVGLVVTALGFFTIFFRDLFLAAFEEDLARVSGVRVTFLNYAFIILAGFTVAASIRIVGVLLIGALMVVPVLSALQFGRGFRGTLLIAMGFSLVSFFVGYFVSYHLDLPSGGSTVLAAVAFFLLSFFGNAIARRTAFGRGRSVLDPAQA